MVITVPLFPFMPMISSDYKSFEAESDSVTGAKNTVKQRSHLRMGSSRMSHFDIPTALQF